jgi:hypothetical protein
MKASERVAERVVATQLAAAKAGQAHGVEAGHFPDVVRIVHEHPTMSKAIIRGAGNTTALIAGAVIATRFIDDAPKDGDEGNITAATASQPFQAPLVVGASAGAAILGFKSRGSGGSNWVNRAMIYGGVGGVVAVTLGDEIRQQARNALRGGMNAVLPEIIVDVMFGIPSPNSIVNGIKHGIAATGSAIDDSYKINKHYKVDQTMSGEEYERFLRTGRGLEDVEIPKGEVK